MTMNEKLPSCVYIPFTKSINFSIKILFDFAMYSTLFPVNAEFSRQKKELPIIFAFRFSHLLKFLTLSNRKNSGRKLKLLSLLL